MPDPKISIGSVILAAGQARRMGPGGSHKLLAEFDGTPLIRRTAETVLSASVSPAVVVTGHRRREIEEALRGLDLRLRFNADYGSGMGSSLACGFRDEGLRDRDGVLVMLGDMPAVTPDHVERLVTAFCRHGGSAVVRASSDGHPGNPVIIPKALHDLMRNLSGDHGARSLIRQSALPVVDIDIGPAALLDVDTVEAVKQAGGILKG